jgi:excisionase family DNA binding protein
VTARRHGGKGVDRHAPAHCDPVISLDVVRADAGLRRVCNPNGSWHHGAAGVKNSVPVLTCRLDDLIAALRRELQSLADLHDRVLTRSDLAKLLQLDEKTISALVKKHGLPARRVGRVYRFLLSEVLAWLKKQQSGAVKPSEPRRDEQERHHVQP